MIVHFYCRSFECCGLKDGDWQSFEHMSESIQKIFQVKIGIDDWDSEFALIAKFNNEKNSRFEANLLNVDEIIETCSQEGFNLPNTKEKLLQEKIQRSLHLDQIIAYCSKDYDFY